MGIWTRLPGWVSVRWAPRATLVENGRVVRERATWPEIERAIRKYFPGDDWFYFDLRLGDFDAGRYMIVSSQTRCADLFAVLATFDGTTFYSPSPEIGMGTYATGATDVYPDDRCVTTATAFRVARVFCERRELDPAVEWRSFTGTGYVSGQPRGERSQAAEGFAAPDTGRE
jgi:hypothetical protein